LLHARERRSAVIQTTDIPASPVRMVTKSAATAEERP
jgi:hypothetical protein